jgi:3-oxoacyl-[acyl-carrier-protein] synthase-3
MHTSILGLGHHLPPVVEQAGVRRPTALEPGGPSTLALKAATDALARAAVAVDGVDFIVFATMTPDVTFPGSGCYFQHQLGCGTTGALDIRAQCAGFLFGLAVADQFIRIGTYKRVLLAGAEVHSSGLDYSERGQAVARLYGDGAGVALVGASNGPDGLRSIVLHTDGRRHKQFWCEYPSSRQHPVRMTVDDFRRARHFPTIDFEAVRQFGEESLTTVIREALEKAGTVPAHVDRYIVAHVLPEVAENIAVHLQIAPARLNIPAQRYGHLTAAALPVALSEEVAAGQLGPGATVCLAASGAGFAWGAAVLTL